MIAPSCVPPGQHCERREHGTRDPKSGTYDRLAHAVTATICASDG